MKKLFTLLLFGVGLATGVLMTVEPAQAILGEVVDSVSSDKKVLAANGVTTTVHQGYSVQQVNADAVIMREFIAPSGVIFAIAWRGLSHPDLTLLLGTYTSEYEESLRHVRRQPDRRRLHMETNRIVVEKWGHMRNLQGRAYVPALIPVGVTVDEIR